MQPGVRRVAANARKQAAAAARAAASGVPSVEARSALAHAASARALAEAAPSVANQVPHISRISPVYLPYTSRIPPVYLPHISPMSPLCRPRSRARWRRSGRRGRRPLWAASSRRAVRRRRCRGRSLRPPAQLTYTSLISPPHLPYISPLHLPYISRRSVRRRARRGSGGGDTRRSRGSVAGGRASPRMARRSWERG